MNSKAKLKAVEKYNAKTYDKITLRMRKEEAEELRKHVGGESLNGFIVSAIREKMGRDLQAPTEIERTPFFD